MFRKRVCVSSIKKISLISLLFYQYKTKKVEMKELNQNYYKKFQNSFFPQIEIELTKPLEIGKPQEVIIKSFERNKKIIIVKLEDNLIRAFYPYCPYDKKTNLIDSVFIQDKIICPTHGCEFNINSGFLENGPCLDNMIVFFGIQKENNKIILKIPENRPISTNPLVVKKNYNDFRKIAIVGSGPAGIASAENLRKIGYEGQILLFTKETSAPVQKHNLTKFTDFKKNRKMLFFRDYEYFKNIDVNIFYGMSVKNITNDFNHISFLEAENGAKYLYDGIIIATGDSLKKNLESETIAKNVVILDNIFDFKKSEKLLKKAKNVIINYITFESLELASTLKKNYPDLKISVLECSDKSYLENNLGKLSDDIIKYFRTQGIKFYFCSKEKREMIMENKKIKYITLTTKKPKNKEKVTKKLKSDIFYTFDPNRGNKKGFLSNDNKKILQTGINDRFIINAKQRTYEENIYIAGTAGTTRDPLTKKQPEHIHYTDTLNQAEIAAYNIMGLDLPLKKPFFSYYNFFGKTFQKVGTTENTEMITIGDIKNLNFINFYIDNNILIGAVASGIDNNRKLLLIREALKLKTKIFVDENELKNQDEFFQKIFNKVNTDKFGGCFAERFWERRFKPIDRCVLFKDISWYEEMNISRFINKGYNLDD